MVAVLLLLAASSPGAELRLDENQIFLRADHESLRDVLGEFVRLGVEVQAEPDIDADVHGILDGEPVGAGLRTLLESFNYVLYWDQLAGPAGPITRLSAIHVFRPGHQDHAIPFQPAGLQLAVVRRPGVPAHVKDEVLLGVKSGTTQNQFREILAGVGGTVVSSIPSFGIYQIRLPRDTDATAVAEALVGNPWVAAAEPNYVHELPAPTHLPQSASAATAGTSAPATPGASRVAIFDSGVTDLDQLGENVVGSYDSVEPGRDMADPVGHGTQMALIASGSVTPGGAQADPESTPVLAVRSFDDNGMTSNYSLLRGIDYTIEQGGRVASMSWGTEVNSDFLAHAVGYAQDQGIVVVASAGNEPTGEAVYPAAYEGVIAVSALMPDGSVWENSNYGSFISVAAPGTGEFPVGYNGPPGAYAGTSIASPYVARIVGQYFDLHPTATAADAIKALNAAVTDAGETGFDPYYGNGALDQAAIRRLLEEGP